jgi:hypothetical protein
MAITPFPQVLAVKPPLCSLHRHQDWNGRYVVVLNSVYKDAVKQQKVPWLHFKEILIPIPDLALDVKSLDHQLYQVATIQTAVGPSSFVVKTSKLTLVDYMPLTGTCRNPICDGRHLQGTRYAIPFYGVKPLPITGFKLRVTLADHPDLSKVHIRSSSLAQLFCTKSFLGLLHLFRRKAHNDAGSH